MRPRAPLAAPVLLAAVAFAAPAAAQGPDFEKVQIKTEKVGEGIWVLAGAGGNIGVSVGADGRWARGRGSSPATGRWARAPTCAPTATCS